MIEIKINDLPCQIVTPELAAALHSIGEDASKFNRVSWPAGASQHASGLFLMTAANAKSLADSGRTNSFIIDMIDDHVDVVRFDEMFQGIHRPIHFRNDSLGLVAVPVHDARYYWKGNITGDVASSNVTLQSDRTQYFDATATADWQTFVSYLLTSLGIESDTDTTGVQELTIKPRDYLINSEPSAVMIDRVCAILGLIFTASPYVVDAEDRYSLDSPSSANVGEPGDGLRSPGSVVFQSIVSGGICYSTSTDEGKATLDAEMPSSVTVLFPRADTGVDLGKKTDANAPEVNQFNKLTSTEGKPDGITGRADSTVLIYDSLFSLGPIGAETNTSELQSRADDIATMYYRRFDLDKVDVRLRGLHAFSNIAGLATWMVNSEGAFTDFHTSDDWYAFGGDRNVLGGFLDKHVVGMDGLLITKTWDGGLRVYNTNSKPSVFAVRVKATVASKVLVGGWCNEIHESPCNEGCGDNLSDYAKVVYVPKDDSVSECSSCVGPSTVAVRYNLFDYATGETQLDEVNDVEAEDYDPLTDGVKPLKHRVPLIEYHPAEDSTVGFAFYDDEGNIQLWDAVDEYAIGVGQISIDIPKATVITKDDGTTFLANVAMRLQFAEGTIAAIDSKCPEDIIEIEDC